MTLFTVKKGVRVTIASSVNAAYPQRFIIERQSPTHPGLWEGMGKKTYAGGESPGFAADAADRIWKITCQNKNGPWVHSRERVTEAGPSERIIYCDDDMTGDGDFNDLIVRIKFKDHEEGSDASKDENGDGIFKPPYKKHLPFDPDPGKGKYPL
ncbi:MAG: hypothetical protein ABW019_06290 [Chitinophagaceae bacterium]